MRKFPFLVTAFATVTLFSCTDSKVYKIGVSQCSDDDWRQKMNAEIRRELMFHPEATVEILSADDSSDKQIEQIRYFMDNGFDLIIAAPNEAEALTPVIEEAYENGIPVVLFDRNIKSDKFTAWQGADNTSIGRAASRYALTKKGSGLRAVEIYGLQGSSPADERHKGFVSDSSITILGLGYGDWKSDKAAIVADSLLTLYPDVDIVFAHNDRMAIAAAEVARSKNLNPLIIGIDAAPEIGLPAVADSIIDVTFLYPTEGQRIVRTALAILKGEKYERITYLSSETPVDETDIDILLYQNESLNDETKKLVLLKDQLDEYWSKHTSQTTVFYGVLIIVLLLFGLLFMLLRAFWQHKRHQNSLIKQNRLLQEERDKQKVLNDQLDEAMSSKLAFFTNVSHDLRTPLTLIAEPIEKISESENIDEKEKYLMKIARKNVQILHRLINQILDFRKYESDKLELKLSETDLLQHLKDWSSAFETLASRKNIKFELQYDNLEEISMAIDIEKMERIFYNIVSNAFKYTQDGGSIIIGIKTADNKAILTIQDTGKGIPAKDLPNIFDRFFQGDQINPTGSGIGLFLAKAFVELHNGTIEIESEIGKGTTFTIVIPIVHTESVLPYEQTISTEFVDIEHQDLRTQNDIAVTPDQPLILVIDDNTDICALLSDMLSDKYVVISAHHGEEGIRLAKKYVPDLIICDVMMPGMDGLECCEILKSDLTTSHIPILMLTACVMDEQRVAGYEVGADGYISKPFNAKVLLARIKNLIASRQQIRKLNQSSDKYESSDKTASPVTAIENTFYNKFIDIFNANMSNPDLSVETIASEMGLGYSQLYRKIKSLTNYRPVELMRLLRLEKARELMRDTEKTISEISYEVGFSTPAYFTKCYREHFGETPSDTRTNK